jgi:hypothetical protein
MTHFFQRPQLGNAAEYLLPALIIGVVVLSQGMLQGNLGTSEASFSHLFQGSMGEDLAGKPSHQLVSKMYGMNPYLTSLKLRLPNGKTIFLKNVPQNPSQMVEVDGGHGTTSQLLAVLDQLIQELERSGEDPQTLSALKELSNAGFSFGNSQKTIETLAQKCQSNKLCFTNEIVLANGKLLAEYNAISFSANRSVNGPIDSPYFTGNAITDSQLAALDLLYPKFIPTAQNNPMNDYSPKNFLIGEGFARFLDAYKRVSDTPSQSAEVNSLVKGLAQNLFHLAYASQTAASMSATWVNFEDGGKTDQLTLGSYPNETPDKLLKNQSIHMKGNLPPNASDLTNLHSGTVCELGQHQVAAGECR